MKGKYCRTLKIADRLEFRNIFSGTKQMEVSFMLVVLAVKKITIALSAIYKRKKA